MYDLTSGIEVLIRPYLSRVARAEQTSKRESCQEYQPPKRSALSTGNVRESYIEAITGQRFEIVVILHSDFDFMGQSCLDVIYEMDGGTVRDSDVLLQEPWAVINQSGLVKSSTVVRRSSKWHAHGFVMGQRWLDDDLLLSKDEEAIQIRQSGNIKVTLRRGHANSIPKSRPDNCATRTLESTTKSVTVDHGKSHYIQLVDCRKETDWSGGMQIATAKGDAAEAITFTFFYTSKMFLASQHMMPRTSATPAEGSSTSGSNDHTNTGKADKSSSKGTHDFDNEEAPLPKKFKRESQHDVPLGTASHESRTRAKRATPQSRPKKKV